MAMHFKFRVPKFLKSVRYMLAVVNGVFLTTGLLLLFVGIAVLVRYSEYDELITDRFFNIAGFVIATAVVILLGSVLGFYGAYSRHFYVVGAYEVLLLVVLVFEISIIIVGFSLNEDAAKVIKTPMVETLQLYGSRIEITTKWDDMQMKFQCCGVVGRFDWISSQIPVTCCFIDIGTISPFECTTANAYGVGCADALGEHLAYQAYVIAVTGTVVTCIQIVLATLTAYLTWRTKYEEIELES